MSYRIEEKLLIDKNSIIDFKSLLSKKTAQQLYQQRKIESLYFDNLNYEMYNDSIEGLTPRKKIRIRNYPNTKDKNQYLEVKVSSVEGRFKTRNNINKEKLDYLKKKGILDNQYGLCKPCIYVDYDREYFKLGDVRISIDNNIRYKLFPEKNFYNDTRSIVEIKTSIKKNLDTLIHDFPFQRIRFSKYCNAVEKVIFK